MAGIGEIRPIDQGGLVDRRGAQRVGLSGLNHVDALGDGVDDALCMGRVGLSGDHRRTKVAFENRQRARADGLGLLPVLDGLPRGALRQVPRIADPEQGHGSPPLSPGAGGDLRPDPGRLTAADDDGGHRGLLVCVDNGGRGPKIGQ